MLAAAAAMACTATLCACSGDDKPAKASGPLNVWVRGAGDSIKAYQAIFDAFTAKTGVQIKPFMTLTDFETKLSAAATSHALPDVVVDDAAQLGNFETQGIVQEVDRTTIAGQDQLTDRAWDSAKDLQGKYQAIPFSAQANLLLVRSDWLTRLGLKAPTTWDELKSVAAAFTTRDPDGNGKADTYGLAVPGSTTRGYISWYWSSLLWQSGGDYFSANGNGKFTATLDSPRSLASVQYFESLFCGSPKLVQPSALNDTTTETNKAFQTGVAGMYFTGPYAFATMDATKIKGKYTAVAPPAGPANAQTLAEGTDIYLMAGGRKSDGQKLAEYMISPEAQKLGMTAVPSATIVRLPVNSSVNAGAEHKNDARWTLAQTVYQNNGHYENINLPNWTALRQATSTGLNALVASCADPKAALGKLNDKLNGILKQQGVRA
jgi:multiple sugar transport system substrate-binding protein